MAAKISNEGKYFEHFVLKLRIVCEMNKEALGAMKKVRSVITTLECVLNHVDI